MEHTNHSGTRTSVNFLEVQDIFIGVALVAHANFEARHTPTEYKNISYYSLVNPGICSYQQGNIFNDHKKMLYDLLSRETDDSMCPRKYESFIKYGFTEIKERYLEELLVAQPRCREVHRAITSHKSDMFHHDFNKFVKGLSFLENDKEEHNNGIYITSLFLKIGGKWRTVPQYCPHINDVTAEFDSKSMFNILHSNNRLKLINILGKYGVQYKKSKKRRLSRTDSYLQEFTEFLQDFSVNTKINILDLSCNNPTGASKAIPAVEQMRLTKQFIL